MQGWRKCSSRIIMWYISFFIIIEGKFQKQAGESVQAELLCDTYHFSSSLRVNFKNKLLHSMVNSMRLSDAYMYQYNIPTLVPIVACRLFGTKPLSKPMLPYCQLVAKEYISVKFYLKFQSFHSRKCTWKCRLRNVLRKKHTIRAHTFSLHNKPLPWTSQFQFAQTELDLYQWYFNMNMHKKCHYG